MSFWDVFLGNVFADIVADEKKQKQSNEKWNNLYYELLDYETKFSEYLKSVNCSAIYITDVEAVNKGSIYPEKKKMDNYKMKLNEFISLGGQAKFIFELDELDNALEKIKYLKEMGCIHRQEEFLNKDIHLIKSILEKEKNEGNAKASGSENINSNKVVLDGIGFENLCKNLLENMGFEVFTTKKVGDGGIDLIAFNTQPLLSGKYIIQCKRYTGSVGEPVIRDLYGVVMSERANKGIVITTGYFTKSAIAFSENKPIELIDGDKLNSLLIKNNLGIIYNSIYADEEKESDILDETVNLSVKEVIERGFELKDKYEKYICEIQNDLDNNGSEHANYINWLVEISLEDDFYINDFDERLVIFKEIKKQIKEYISNSAKDTSAARKVLSYLYQMTYIQICILEGEFNEARDIFAELMKHEELQLTPIESIEPTKTKFLFDNQIVFQWLSYTWYDLIQLAVLVDDFKYETYLTLTSKFHGLLSLEYHRLQSTINDIKSGALECGNIAYFENMLNDYREIQEASCIEQSIHLNHLFIITSAPLRNAYFHLYKNAELTYGGPDYYNIFLKDNKLVIDGYGEIKNINQKINRWTAYNP